MFTSYDLARTIVDDRLRTASQQRRARQARPGRLRSRVRLARLPRLARPTSADADTDTRG